MAGKSKPGQTPWAGTDANERAVGRVQNALVSIILDGVAGVSPELPGHGWRQISPGDADQWIERGRKVLADLESQACAPGGAQGKTQKWMDHKIDELKRWVSDAEAVRSGKKPQKMKSKDYEELRKSLGVHAPRKLHTPHAGRGRGYKARQVHAQPRGDDELISMTYGQLPPFEQFEHDVHTRIDPDHDGQPIVDGYAASWHEEGGGEVDESRARSTIQWEPSSGGTEWRGTGASGRTYLLRRAGPRFSIGNAQRWNLHIDGKQYGPFESLDAGKSEADRMEQFSFPRRHGAPPRQMRDAATERLYHVIAKNERTGKKTYLTSTPVTHQEGVTIIYKQSPPRRDVRIQLEPAHAGSRYNPETGTVSASRSAHHPIPARPRRPR